MKKELLFLLSTTLTSVAFGQNDYNVEMKQKVKPTVQQIKDQISKCNFIYTFDFKVGDRFIFEKSEVAIQQNWEMQWYFLIKEFNKPDYNRTKLYHKDYAGKIVKVIKIEDKKGIVSPDTYYTFEVDGSNDQICLKALFSINYQKKRFEESASKKQIYELPYLIYLPEIDSARKYLIGKNYYTKFLSNGTRYDLIKITKIGAGSNYAPVRIVFENAKGDESFKDVCLCGTNVPDTFIAFNHFDKYFSEDNPKKNYNGDDETWNIIKQRKIRIGMTEDNLILSWGKPEKINETVVLGVITKQYIYSDQYVYLDNGKITAFQSSK